MYRRGEVRLGDVSVQPENRETWRIIASGPGYRRFDGSLLSFFPSFPLLLLMHSSGADLSSYFPQYGKGKLFMTISEYSDKTIKDFNKL